jgi:hypothetical protein
LRTVTEEWGESYEAFICDQSEPLPAVNDLTNQRLRVDLTPQTQSAAAAIAAGGQMSETLPGATLSAQRFLSLVAGGASGEVFYVLASSTSSGGSDYAATPHSVVNDFQTDLFAGNFATSYPIPVPPSVAGPVPGVTLHYNSGNVWGMADNTNGQAGQTGFGWELEPGTISLFTLKYLVGSYWYLASKDAHFISLNGVRSKLVNVSGNLYRLESDPSWKVERLTSSEGGHPDTGTKTYWLVTTPDGTKYRFGGEAEPLNENATSSRDQNSVAYAPLEAPGYVYYPNPKAYKWYLDRVEDVHGNLINYVYGQEYNHYEAPGSMSARYRYVRATHLRYIEYSKRAGQLAQPHARILFNMEIRCTDASSITCPTAASLPDAPQDFVCTSLLSVACVHTMPTFWSDLRLDSIQTQVYDQTMATWRTAALYDLRYTFPTPPGPGTPKRLWLQGVEQRPGGAYNRLAFSQIEAESYDGWSGAAGGDVSGNVYDTGSWQYVRSMSATGYLIYRQVDFGSGSHQALIRHRSAGGGVQLELRLDSPTGTKIGELVESSPTAWRTEAVALTNASGIHDLYIVFKRTNVYLNWLRFLPTTALPAGLPAAEYTPAMLQGPVSTAHHLPVMGTVRTELGGTVNHLRPDPSLCRQLHHCAPAL